MAVVLATGAYVLFGHRECGSSMELSDLDGPDGNAFFLMGLARRICKEMGADPDPVIADMTNSDYEHLIDTFDRYFGEYVDLYRSPVKMRA